MKKNKILLVAMLVLAIATFVVGCGKKTIEEMLTEADLKQISQDMIAGNTDVYSDAAVEVKGNSINYIFYFVDGIDVEAVKKGLANSTDLAAIKDDAVKYFQDKVGITPEVDYEFRDVNGNLIFSSKTGAAPSVETETKAVTEDVVDEEPVEESVVEEAVDEATTGEYSALAPDGSTVTFSTLEEYFANPSVKKDFESTLDSMMETYSSVYSGCDYEIIGNDVIYRYYYVEGTDPELTKKGFESQDMDAAVESGMDSLYRATGIRPEYFAYEYYTVDGDLIVGFYGE